ncbi:MAG: cytochrome c3 family protein [Desulfobacterales bacterium]
MGKFSIIKVVIALLVIVGLAAGAWCQDEMEVVASGMFDSSRRPAPAFPHDSHNEAAEIEACNVCHHVYNDDGTLAADESSEDQACADCHEMNDAGRRPGLMKAYHLNCKGCHQEKAAGPVSCGECHVKD